MNVGVLPVDSLIPNLALMRLSAWHKAQGDRVEVAFPLAADTYDRVYRSKQFDFTPEDTVPWPCEVISGGTGYDLTALLTPEQDTTYPDNWDDLTDDVLGEVNRAQTKHGFDNTPMGAMPYAMKAAVLSEEVGEVARWVNERFLGNHPAWSDLRSELVQVAAVSLMWALSLNDTKEADDA
jgi:hypothetical protein